MDQILFSESQRMTGGGITVAVIAVLLLVGFRGYRRMSWMVRGVLLVVLLLMAATCTLLFTLRLQTVYYPRFAAYRFASVYGAAYDTVSMDTVVHVQVLRYDPAVYGGWGDKGDKDTRVYNASGNKGILFTFRNGRKLLLGTQQPDTLESRIHGYYPVGNGIQAPK